MRIVSGPPWTTDGRWVVVAEWHGSERIVYDPDNGVSGHVENGMLALMDLADCQDFVKEHA